MAQAPFDITQLLNRQWATPRWTAAQGARKTPISISDSMRRNRIEAPAQCRDLSSKLANLDRMIASTDREYRTMLAELDRLDNEGRVWLVIDFIHKTSLATLDLGAAIMETVGHKGGAAVRHLADGVHGASETWIGAQGVADGSVKPSEFGMTVAQRALGNASPRGAGGNVARGTADILLTGASNLQNIRDAQGTHAAGARTAEAGVDLIGGLIQRTADTVDSGTPGGSPVAKRVGAAAQIARAMASYNREIEGVFNRRQEVSGGLNETRMSYRTTMERHLTRFRQQAAEIRALLAADCR